MSRVLRVIMWNPNLTDKIYGNMLVCVHSVDRLHNRGVENTTKEMCRFLVIKRNQIGSLVGNYNFFSPFLPITAATSEVATSPRHTTFHGAKV